MTPFDLFLIAVLILFVLYGLRSGLINMIFSLVGLVIGVALAGRWYGGFGQWLGTFVFTNSLLAQVVGFSMLLFLINFFLGLAFGMVNKIFKILSIIPGVGALNRLAGAALGLIEGILLIGVILFVATKFDISPAWKGTLEHSALTPILIGASQLIVPFLPKALKSLQTILR